MKHAIKDLTGFTIGATDGEIGKVKDFFFDDSTWTVRYLVVETGGWLSGRSVLISPQALLKPDWDAEVFPVNLTKEQVESSPDIDTDKPVSKQEELKLYSHYPWTGYGAGSLWGGGIGTTGMVLPGPNMVEVENADNNIEEREIEGDHNLRSTHAVTGYNIEANDDGIGDVEDFIIDDDSWKIDFMIVDTGTWLPGKKVLISPSWVKKIDWGMSNVKVNASKEQVKNSPEYDADEKITEDYADELYKHYGQPRIDKRG